MSYRAELVSPELYHVREDLKRLRFRWSPDDRAWVKNHPYQEQLEEDVYEIEKLVKGKVNWKVFEGDELIEEMSGL